MGEFQRQDAAGAIDDVLHLDAMEMRRRLLALADDQQLLGVGFPLGIALDAVAHAKQRQAAPGKIARPEVGDVPAHLMVAQILRRLAGFGEILDRPVRPSRQGPTIGLQELDGLTDGGVDLRSFHLAPRERRRESRLNAVWSVSTRASTAINGSARKPRAGRRIAIRSPGEAPTGDALSVATPDS